MKIILKNKIKYINSLIDDIFKENEKYKKELQNILFNDDKKINTVNTKENNDILYNNFDIKSKEIIHILKDNNKASVYCSIVLKDNRFVVGSSSNIIIYNNKTFKPDLIIKEHYS